MLRRSVSLLLLLPAFGLMGACSQKPDSDTQVFVQDNILFIAGTLDRSAKPLILMALDDNQDIETIAFTVNPGSIDDESTIALGREIRRRGLKTTLASGGGLVSGGLTLFLSGTERTLEGTATVGVHSWQGCSGSAGGKAVCVDAQDIPSEDPAHRLHGDYLREMLGSEDFYWFSIRAAPSRSVHWLSSDEIAQYGLAAPRTDGGRLRVPAQFDPEVLRPRLCRNCPAP